MWGAASEPGVLRTVRFRSFFVPFRFVPYRSASVAARRIVFRSASAGRALYLDAGGRLSLSCSSPSAFRPVLLARFIPLRFCHPVSFSRSCFSPSALRPVSTTPFIPLRSCSPASLRFSRLRFPVGTRERTLFLAFAWKRCGLRRRLPLLPTSSEGPIRGMRGKTGPGSLRTPPACGKRGRGFPSFSGSVGFGQAAVRCRFVTRAGRFRRSPPPPREGIRVSRRQDGHFGRSVRHGIQSPFVILLTEKSFRLFKIIVNFAKLQYPD